MTSNDQHSLKCATTADTDSFIVTTVNHAKYLLQMEY